MQNSTLLASKIKPYLFCLGTSHTLGTAQYESKSYRRFTEFLEECVGIQEYLGLSQIPHFTTLQKAAARLNGNLLHKMLQEFILYKKVRLVLAGIDGSGFSYSTASYYTKRIQLRQGISKSCGLCRHEFTACLRCDDPPQHATR